VKYWKEIFLTTVAFQEQINRWDICSLRYRVLFPMAFKQNRRNIARTFSTREPKNWTFDLWPFHVSGRICCAGCMDVNKGANSWWLSSRNGDKSRDILDILLLLANISRNNVHAPVYRSFVNLREYHWRHINDDYSNVRGARSRCLLKVSRPRQTPRNPLFTFFFLHEIKIVIKGLDPK